MFNSAEHEILNAHRSKKISRNSAFLGSEKPRMILSFRSYMLKCYQLLSFNIYEQEKFHAKLS